MAVDEIPKNIVKYQSEIFTLLENSRLAGKARSKSYGPTSVAASAWSSIVDVKPEDNEIMKLYMISFGDNMLYNFNAKVYIDGAWLIDGDEIISTNVDFEFKTPILVRSGISYQFQNRSSSISNDYEFTVFYTEYDRRLVNELLQELGLTRI